MRIAVTKTSRTLYFYFSALLISALFVKFNPAAQTQLFLWLNQLLTSPTNQQFWHITTQFGDGIYLFAASMLLFHSRAQQQADLIFTMLITLIAVYLLKSSFAFPRPAAVLPIEDFTVIGSALTSYNSLPSGHTATAFIMARLCLQLNHRPLFLLALSCATLVGLSRIAVGAHWPLDVVLGAMTGWLCAEFGIRASTNFVAGTKIKLTYIVLGVISSVALLTKASENPNNDSLLIIQLGLAIFALTMSIWQAMQFLLPPVVNPATSKA